MKTVDARLFDEMIPVARPWFSEAEERILAETVQSGWVAQGPRVREFEECLAAYVGVPHAVATNSCTSALQLSLEILGAGPGDEVIVPSFTFVATANAVVHCGAKPVFADIDPRTYNLDPKVVEAAFTPRTKGILAVDQVGLPADLDALHEIVKRKGAWVLEDAACALGSEYRGKKIGSVSKLTCFSFHPRKVITTGEGGMIMAPNPVHAERARTLVSHGASVSDLVRHQSKRMMVEEYRVCGYNYRMSDLQAALGIAQFRKLSTILDRRRHLAQRYSEAFRSMPEVVPPWEPPDVKTNYQSYLIRIHDQAGRSRDDLMQYMQDRKIATRRGIMAIHTEPAYRERFGEIRLPETEKAVRETMILPLYPQMTEEEQDRVIETLKRALSS